MRASALALGFALGGFFDGILLHQVLQWHHLLDAFDRDLAFQIAADGVFHAVVYLICIASLIGLVAARRELAIANGARRLLGLAAIGFGVWHLVDAVLVHWILGWHRIRMDVDHPLAWDVGWLVAFGAVPIAAGVTISRGRSGGGFGRRGLIAVAATTAALGWIAARPAPGADRVVIAFAPHVPAERAMAAVTTLGGPIDTFDAERGLYVVRSSGATAGDWIASGAWFVGGAQGVSGCLGAARGA